MGYIVRYGGKNWKTWRQISVVDTLKATKIGTC